MSRSIIHRADADLKHAWLARFQALPPSARHALREALLDLRRDAQHRAELQWRRHKGPHGLLLAGRRRLCGPYRPRLALTRPA